MFQVISASTNTGFQFIEMSVLSDEGKILLIIIMLIGGTAFSMAGGIKVGRILQIVQKITKKNLSQMLQLSQYLGFHRGIIIKRITSMSQNLKR